MICKRCGVDTLHEHMSTTVPGVCRRCTYHGLPGGDALADMVNAQATRKTQARRDRQAQGAPRHDYRSD